MARIVVDVDDDLLVLLASEADHDGVSIDTVLRRAFRRYVAAERTVDDKDRG